MIRDLERFAPRGAIDPVYLDSPYYLYPDGPIAVEAQRVIGAARRRLLDRQSAGLAPFTNGARILAALSSMEIHDLRDKS